MGPAGHRVRLEPSLNVTLEPSLNVSLEGSHVHSHSLCSTSQSPFLGLPSARPSVTSATDLTSQDEQSPDLDPSSEDERDGVTGSPQIQVNENYPSTFLTQPNK